MLQILAAPRGLEVVVGEPVIHDPAEPIHIEAGDLVLAIGVNAASREAAELVATGGKHRASALAIKLRGQPSSELLEAAETSNIALVGVPPEMTWDQFHRLLRTAIASAPGHERGRSDAALGDLFALANAVATMVGGPVTIEDPQSRVLAYSNLDEPIDVPRRQTILGRQVPARWLRRLVEAGVFEKLWTTNDVVRVDGLPEAGLRPRIAMAVRAGDEILGSIWVAQGRTPLGPEAEEPLREAAAIASLHLIRYQAGRDLDQRRRGDLLRAVLEGRGSAGVLASQLGVDAAASFTVVAFKVGRSEPVAATRTEGVVDLIVLYAEGLSRRATCVTVDETIYVLIPAGETLKRERLAHFAERVIERAASGLKVSLNAGIGSGVAKVDDVQHSRREADQVVRVLAQAKGARAALIESVRPQTLILELQDIAAARPELLTGRLQTLVEHDLKHKTDYVASLRAWLDLFGDVSAAALVVGVHANTFRYRLGRIRELSGLNLDDPEERLITELQLRFLTAAQ